MLAHMRRDKHDGYTGCGKDDHCAEPCVEKAGKCESRYDQSASEENKPGNRTQDGCSTGCGMAAPCHEPARTRVRCNA